MKKTKEKIIRSAIEVLGQNSKATLDDIAVNANITRRTLHRHYNGKGELIISILNFLVDEYSKTIERVFAKNEDTLKTLKSLLINDIENANNYLVFKHLQTIYYPNFSTENDKAQHIYLLYDIVFEQVKAEEQISKDLSLDWIKLFYSVTVETAIKGIKNGIPLNDCMKMAQLTFWNGIKQ